MRPLRRNSTDTRATDLTRRVEALERRYDGKGFYEIKLAADDAEPDITEFIFTIPDDLDGTHLSYAEGFVTTVGSSATIMQINNRTQTQDMLTDRITIDSGDLDSRASASPSVIDPTTNEVEARDQIAVEIDSAGTGAFGTGVTLRFD